MNPVRSAKPGPDHRIIQLTCRLVSNKKNAHCFKPLRCGVVVMQQFLTDTGKVLPGNHSHNRAHTRLAALPLLSSLSWGRKIILFKNHILKFKKMHSPIFHTPEREGLCLINFLSYQQQITDQVLKMCLGLST